MAASSSSSRREASFRVKCIDAAFRVSPLLINRERIGEGAEVAMWLPGQTRSLFDVV
jgi:hypothetical protein